MISNYVTVMVNAGQEVAMVATANSIAQEIRTPLFSIGITATGLANYIPPLTAGYEFALRNHHPMPRIKRIHVKSIEASLMRVKEDVKYSNAVIDTLLLEVNKEKIESSEKTECSMQECLKVALNEYPFTEDELTILNLMSRTDFIFLGNQKLMVNVFFNLFKNAVKSIAQKQSGEIFIEVEISNKGNLVIVKNTGRGIPYELLPHAFERFYAFANDKDSVLGGGIGLAYCKDVMSMFGGRIECCSVYNVSTEFKMYFPSL